MKRLKKGRVTAMVCSGDSGIYGMAGLMYEIGEEYPEVEIEGSSGCDSSNWGEQQCLVHRLDTIAV